MELPYETGNFSSAVLFGDKHSLGEETTRILRLCGLSHISVVSGLDAIVDKVLDEVTDATVTENHCSTASIR